MAVATDNTKTALQSAQERGAHLRRQAYASEVWSMAQSESSKLKMDGCTHKNVTDNLTWFTRISPTNWRKKKGGVQPTPYVEGKYDRRGLITQTYDTAMIADKDDLVDFSTNIFADRKSEDAKALGRLCDQIILNSLIDKTLEEGNPVSAESVQPIKFDGTTAATQTDERQHFAVGRPVQKFKDICFLPESMGTNSTTVKTLFNADSLEDIKHLFRKRNMSGVELVCAYIPDLQPILRKDPDFKNAENVFSSREVASQTGSGKGFVYKQVRFIEINEDALPNLSTDTIASARTKGTVDNATSEYSLKCRYMSNSDVKGKVGTALPSSSADAGAVVKTVGQVKRSDVLYFWVTKSVYFAERGEMSINMESDRPDYSHAKQMYSRANLGGMLMDEDYVLVMPLRGTVAA